MDGQESGTPLHAFRLLELRLLRCTFATTFTHPPPPGSPAPEVLINLVKLIEAGSYVEALCYSGLFDFNSDSSACLPDSFFSVNLPIAAADDDCCCKVFLLFIAAVAAFLAFTQCNITGPFEKLPGLSKLSATAGSCSDVSCEAQWGSWAQKEIRLAGSELLGKFHSLEYLMFAKKLLMSLKDLDKGITSNLGGLRSISWWLSRVLLVQQRLLDGLSSSLFDQIQFNMNSVLSHFGTFESVIEYWSPELSEEVALAIVSVIHLEAGFVALTYEDSAGARNHFEAAKLASNLKLSVEGVMGFRTVHQVEPVAQLLLVATDRDGNSVDYDYVVKDDDSFAEHSSQTCEGCDVLMAPRIIDDRNGAAQLKPLHQAVILAECSAIEKSRQNDEYQCYEMGPYIEAIDSQRTSNFLVKHLCKIMRVRWESPRSQTKERAITMMDELVGTISKSSPGVCKRMHYCFSLNIPTFSALRKDYGDLLSRFGLIRDALNVYKDLDLWDDLIDCYKLLEKKAAAVDLIKTELTKRPQDSGLWCSYGDVTNDESYYEKALDVSDNTSVRALCSLARSAYIKGDYEKSKVLWKSLIKLNSLYQDGWFELGAAALKSKDVDLALVGFTRAVQLDPENGEAWNNVACLQMAKKRNKEAFVAFKEALRFKRNNWQIWENFGQVAADVGKYSQALLAIDMVLILSKNKNIDMALLERLMVEVEKTASTNTTTRESEMLTELLGKILSKIVHGVGGGKIWGLYARWHKLKGDLTMCSDALLKQVRAYQGSDVWTDSERFKQFAHASMELCKVYQEICSRNDSKKELIAAERHLKGVIKQAVKFSDSQEYKDLLACLSQVQKKLEVGSVPSAA